MSSSVKRLLRSARDCLGRREYRDALQHCKEALAEDKACYEAYIFVGKAAFHLQEYTQAEAAYRRASDLDLRNPLAWQGLAELFAETGAWAAAVDCYRRLLELADAAPPEDPLRSRRPSFQRRYAEAAARAGQLAGAEAAWRVLVEAAAEALAEAEAEAEAAGVDGGGGGDGVAAAEGELLDCLCRLADVQLAADAQDIELRVAARLAAEVEAGGGAAAATPDQVSALESAVRSAVEGEWAEEALELDADHASATLRRIIAMRPPCPPFAPYYDAFLKRLRKYIQAAPPGSMDRHSRRAVLLAAAKATMEGRCGDRAGGCCSPYPYEAALAMLEVEHEVVGAEEPSLDPANPTPFLEPQPLPLLIADCGRVASHLMHSFPWNPTAQLHNALGLRRRAAVAGFDAVAGTAGTGSTAVVVRLPPATAGAAGGGARAGAAGAGGGGRRRQVTGLLLSALSRGARAVSGWLAACELLLEEGAAEAALDAAKEGLKFVAQRDVVGKERLAGAGLLLRLLAGQALLRLLKLEEAQLLLEGLAHGVSEGHVASGELAGIPPINVTQHAKRYQAHVAAARGDLAGCRHRYDELVGGQLMGRSAAPIEAWAHGELGMLLLRQGSAIEGARFQLQAALAALQPALDCAAAAAVSPASTALVAVQQEAAAYQLHLALALWAKGGGNLPYTSPDAAAGTSPDGPNGATSGAGRGPTVVPYREECREMLLAAAVVEGPLQAAAFTWLGHWYGRAAEPRDEHKARRCYQRALALDPLQAEAGEALVAVLRSGGRSETARQLCQELHARAAASPAASSMASPSPILVYPGLLAAAPAAAGVAGAARAEARSGWALRCLSRLQRDLGQSEAAVTSYQTAIRLAPEDAELWEGLGASYQSLGRHTAALKSYGRALELAPGRLYSRLQAAALQYQMGSMPEALSYYRVALAVAPNNAAALLGCGEVLLAQAALAARMGAAGAAAAELATAATLAARATGLSGNLQAGWKLLGDVRMQYAAVPTLESVAATRGSLAPDPSDYPGASASSMESAAASSAAAVDAGLAAARGRIAQLRAARRSYAAAVHLDPRVAGLWGDLGMSYHLQLELAGQHPALEREAGAGEFPAVLRRRALALARGGLRLDPASDWLWGCSGTIAAAAAAESPAAAATAEYCFCRALQLNPRRAPVWAALGRLYAAHGEGGLASRCFDSARSHEPTSIAVWEAMGDAALRRGGVGGSGAVAVGADPRVAAAYRDAADAYEHAQLLGGDVESRLGFVLGALVLRSDGAAADGSVIAAASKAVALQPLLPASHHAQALALEARGDYASAVQAFQTTLQLLEGLDQESPATYEQGTVRQTSPAAAPSRPAVQPFDPRVAPTARIAVQLDLARALAASGRTGEATVLYDTMHQEGAVRDDDFGARLSYGMTLLQANRTAEALTQLAAVLSAAAAPPKLRLTTATTIVRHHVASRRWDEAYGTVLAATADVADDGPMAAGGDGTGERVAKLWLILLAGLVAARAPELEAGLLAPMRQWAAARKDVDTARHECRVLELLCAKHRAVGDVAAALRTAARAVHVDPTDRAARSLLAHVAVQSGPRHAVLASRAAPRERPPYAAAAAGENAAPRLAAPPAEASLAPSAAAAHAAGVVAATAAAAVGGGRLGGAAIVAALREGARRLRRVVHAQPHETSAWYLCALTELQLAIASGGHARLYRSAAVAARAATARARAQLETLPAAPQPAPPPRPPPGMPPVMAMALAAQAARAHAAADPRVTALRAQRGALAEVCVRSLAVLSECHLQLRERGGAGGTATVSATAVAGAEDVRAREAADEGLRLAAAHGVDSSPAHRQLARLHLSQGNMAAAEASYELATKTAAAAAATAATSSQINYELLPLLEWAAVRGAVGRQAEALQQLDAAVTAGVSIAVPAGTAPALRDVAAVQRALLMLQLGEAEAARVAAVEALSVGGVGTAPAASLRAAAHALQAAAALVQASLAETSAADDGGEGSSAVVAARKKSLLEARWAAREALKPLTLAQPAGVIGHRRSAPHAGPSGPGAALAALLLTLAEAGLGKEEAAQEQRQQVARLWPDTAHQPVESFMATAVAHASSPRGGGGGVGGATPEWCNLARAVHCRPWALGEAWCGVVAAVRAR